MNEAYIDELALHAHGLFTFDADGRISGVNQFDGGEIPRFYLARSAGSVLFFADRSVATHVIQELESLVQHEPGVEKFAHCLPKFDAEYRQLLSIESDQASNNGPVYAFPLELSELSANVVAIDTGNAKLLEKYLPQWLPDVGHRAPFWAVICEDHAVAVCASVRITAASHEAGVETHPTFRNHGYARDAVNAWAKAVKERGAVPVYSTDWSNTASKAVAQKLGLRFIGVDYSL